MTTENMVIFPVNLSKRKDRFTRPDTVLHHQERDGGHSWTAPQEKNGTPFVCAAGELCVRFSSTL